jgi:hypothetical protein
VQNAPSTEVPRPEPQMLGITTAIEPTTRLPESISAPAELALILLPLNLVNMITNSGEHRIGNTPITLDLRLAEGQQNVNVKKVLDTAITGETERVSTPDGRFAIG